MSKFKQKYNKLMEGIEDTLIITESLGVKVSEENFEEIMREFESQIDNLIGGNPGHDDFQSETLELVVNDYNTSSPEEERDKIDTYNGFLYNQLRPKLIEVARKELYQFLMSETDSE